MMCKIFWIIVGFVMMALISLVAPVEPSALKSAKTGQDCVVCHGDGPYAPKRADVSPDEWRKVLERLREIQNRYK
jgi:hypothetical protein